jgi:hypothetical protein
MTAATRTITWRSMRPTTKFLAKRKAFFEELGYADCPEIKDRNYFHSICARPPGGILVESAATGSGVAHADCGPAHHFVARNERDVHSH